MLPEILKNSQNSPDIFTVSGTESPTKKISEFAGSLYWPLGTPSTSFLRDSTHMINTLTSIRSTLMCLGSLQLVC